MKCMHAMSHLVVRLLSGEMHACTLECAHLELCIAVLVFTSARLVRLRSVYCWRGTDASSPVCDK